MAVPADPAPGLTIQEKLLLSQAVYKLGAIAWPAVSQLLLAHPCVRGRPDALFGPEACEKHYIELMTSIEQNVPAPDGAHPNAKTHLRLAQTFYLARMQELKEAIAAYEARFTSLVAEIQDIKSGKLDTSIQAELRGVLARKYGKKLLDAWVPEEEEVKAALAAGMEDASGNEQESAGATAADVEEAVEADAEEGPKDEVLQKQDEPAVERTMEVEKEPAPKAGREPSPAASDLSPPPSQPDPAEMEEEVEAEAEAEEAPTTRSGKRKASAQPRGAPQSKRSARKGASPAPTQLSEAPSEQEEAREGKRRKADVEPDAEETEHEPVTTRGRRTGAGTVGARRDQPTPVGRNKKAAQSPAPSIKTKESSPAPSTSRRAPSVSSNASGADDKRGAAAGRRGTRGRGASKSAREQTVESVKEEEGEAADSPEEEAAATRSSTRRGQKREKEEETPAPAAKRGKRDRDSGAQRVSPAPPLSKPRPGREPDADDREPDAPPDDVPDQEPKRSGRSSLTAEGRRTNRASSPREQKSQQKLLYSLLDEVSRHKNGPVFQNPVTKKDAADYFEIIKRPMDLKTIRARIRDGNISSIDEFERDVFLMFANAMMYNDEGSQVYEMAKDMLRGTENQIARFRSLQHDMER